MRISLQVVIPHFATGYGLAKCQRKVEMSPFCAKLRCPLFESLGGPVRGVVNGRATRAFIAP